MRAYAEQLSTKEVPTAEEIATLQIYATALSCANSERGFWWKVFHPVRNNAEQREAKSFQAQVDKLTGKADMEGYVVNGGAKNNELVTLYSEAVDDVLKDKRINDMYEAVKNAIKEKSAAKPTAPAAKEEADNTEKENVVVDEANLTVDAPKSEFHKDEKINEKTMVKGE
jgi:hypothetical protein